MNYDLDAHSAHVRRHYGERKTKDMSDAEKAGLANFIGVTLFALKYYGQKWRYWFNDPIAQDQFHSNLQGAFLTGNIVATHIATANAELPAWLTNDAIVRMFATQGHAPHAQLAMQMLWNNELDGMGEGFLTPEQTLKLRALAQGEMVHPLSMTSFPTEVGVQTPTISDVLISNPFTYGGMLTLAGRASVAMGFPLVGQALVINQMLYSQLSRFGQIMKDTVRLAKAGGAALDALNFMRLTNFSTDTPVGFSTAAGRASGNYGPTVGDVLASADFAADLTIATGSVIRYVNQGVQTRGAYGLRYGMYRYAMAMRRLGVQGDFYSHMGVAATWAMRAVVGVTYALFGKIAQATKFVTGRVTHDDMETAIREDARGAAQSLSSSSGSGSVVAEEGSEPMEESEAAELDPAVLENDITRAPQQEPPRMIANAEVEASQAAALAEAHLDDYYRQMFDEPPERSTEDLSMGERIAALREELEGTALEGDSEAAEAVDRASELNPDPLPEGYAESADPVGVEDTTWWDNPGVNTAVDALGMAQLTYLTGMGLYLPHSGWSDKKKQDIANIDSYVQVYGSAGLFGYQVARQGFNAALDGALESAPPIMALTMGLQGLNNQMVSWAHEDPGKLHGKSSSGNEYFDMLYNGLRKDYKEQTGRNWNAKGVSTSVAEDVHHGAKEGGQAGAEGAGIGAAVGAFAEAGAEAGTVAEPGVGTAVGAGLGAVVGIGSWLIGSSSTNPLSRHKNKDGHKLSEQEYIETLHQLTAENVDMVGRQMLEDQGLPPSMWDTYWKTADRKNLQLEYNLGTKGINDMLGDIYSSAQVAERQYIAYSQMFYETHGIYPDPDHFDEGGSQLFTNWMSTTRMKDDSKFVGGAAMDWDANGAKNPVLAYRDQDKQSPTYGQVVLVTQAYPYLANGQTMDEHRLSAALETAQGPIIDADGNINQGFVTYEANVASYMQMLQEQSALIHESGDADAIKECDAWVVNMWSYMQSSPYYDPGSKMWDPSDTSTWTLEYNRPTRDAFGRAPQDQKQQMYDGLHRDGILPDIPGFKNRPEAGTDPYANPHEMQFEISQGAGDKKKGEYVREGGETIEQHTSTALKRKHGVMHGVGAHSVHSADFDPTWVVPSFDPQHYVPNVKSGGSKYAKKTVQGAANMGGSGMGEGGTRVQEKLTRKDVYAAVMHALTLGKLQELRG